MDEKKDKEEKRVPLLKIVDGANSYRPLVQELIEKYQICFVSF